MYSIRHSLSHKAFIAIASFVLLLAPVLTSAAEKPKKASVAKPSAKKTTGKPSSTKAASQTPPQVDEKTVHASFDTFTLDWMNKLVEAEEFHRTKQVQVTESPEGFSAEYIGYLPQRSIEIRQTEYKDTPFVGTLTYYERTLRCTAKTKEEALQGPFQQVKSSQVREIFRFTKGKWVY